MSLLENALDSLLVEAAFAFPSDDSAFLIQLSALKVSVMYKQNQALDKDQQSVSQSEVYFVEKLQYRKNAIQQYLYILIN